MASRTRTDIRNIAIIAHVDHGKTTLVDHMLRQSGTFRDNQVVAERVMDSNDLEREKGITIMAKNASVHWRDTKINILDTPGHSDFGGEVERVLSMVDGVLLLVDAAEGPLPQTRFVLRKALEMGLAPIVVINKIDRSDARPAEVLDEIMELFIGLGATYEQLDFPIIYAIGKLGIAKKTLDDPSETLEPLLDAVMKFIPPPTVDDDAPFAMVISALEWSDYVGRIAVGRIQTGQLKVGDNVALIKPDGKRETARVTKMYVYEGIARIETPQAGAGDIIALSGFENVYIGETICDTSITEPLMYVDIEEPTIAMYFLVNTSPLAGREGKFVTTPKLRERLYRELRMNVSLRVEDTDSADVFKVSGRGELQLAILIETMRREGFEFAVSRPEVLFRRDADGKLLEPIEHVTIDVPEANVGTVIENLGKRKGEMTAMNPSLDVIRCEFLVPARGLIGFRTEFLTSTRGTGVLHHTFHAWEKYKGPIGGRAKGALVSMETGTSTPYALEMVQERGSLFVGPGIAIYEGMIIGENAREDDLSVNACRMKALTNMRASGSDGIVKLDTPRQLSLEQSIEFLEDDELLEVTPLNIRLRKKILDSTMRQRAKKREAADASPVRTIIALLVPFLMAVVSMSAHGQLQYRLKPATTYDYATNTRVMQKITAMNKEIATTSNFRTITHVKVKEAVLKQYTLDVSYDTAYMHMSSNGVDEAMIETNAIPTTDLISTKDRLTMTSTGAILGTERLYDDASTNSGSLTTSMSGGVINGLRLLFPPYDVGKTSKGDTWTSEIRDTQDLDLKKGILITTLTMNCTYAESLDSNNRKLVRLTVASPDVSLNGEMRKHGSPIDLSGSGTLEGTYLVDAQTGMPLSADIKTIMNMRITLQGPEQNVIPSRTEVRTTYNRIP